MAPNKSDSNGPNSDRQPTLVIVTNCLTLKRRVTLFLHKIKRLRMIDSSVKVAYNYGEQLGSTFNIILRLPKTKRFQNSCPHAYRESSYFIQAKEF